MKEVLVLGGVVIGRNIVDFLVNKEIAMLPQPILKLALIGRIYLMMRINVIVSILYKQILLIFLLRKPKSKFR